MLEVSIPCAVSQHTMCWKSAHHVLEVSILCAGSQHTMCSKSAYHMLEVNLLCAGSRHTMCYESAYYELEVSIPCAGSQHTMCKKSAYRTCSPEKHISKTLSSLLNNLSQREPSILFEFDQMGLVYYSLFGVPAQIFPLILFAEYGFHNNKQSRP